MAIVVVKEVVLEQDGWVYSTQLGRLLYNVTCFLRIYTIS